MPVVKINGVATPVEQGTTVAAALLNAGITAFRTSVQNDARAPICGMGICFECRAKIDGQAHVRSCMVLCKEGMEVETDG